MYIYPRKTAILLFLLLSKVLAEAQNLVPNPGFENMKKFPSCQLTLPKDTFESYISDWLMPTTGTPDIFSMLVNTSCISSPYSTYPNVPYFPVAHRSPHSGNNFAGIEPYQWYREYLEIKLTNPLIPGEVYCCQMYVARNPATLYSQDCIGMYFSDELIDANNSGNDLLVYPAQIESDTVINDTAWVKISGAFRAKSAAQYLIIGNFCDVNQMQFDTPDTTQQNKKYNGTYYYLDDISVEKLAPPPIQISGNTPICPGQKLTLTASGWDNLYWSEFKKSPFYLSTGPVVNLTPTPSNNAFIINGTYCEWAISDTVYVSFNPVYSIDLGNDTLICQGTPLILDAGAGLFNYLWQDSSTSETFIASQPGIYSVTASNSYGCAASDKIKIGFYQPPVFSLGEDIEQCVPDGILNAYTGNGYDKYLWNDGSTNAEHKYQQEGIYWATAENPCGISYTDTVEIRRVNLFIPNLITPNDDAMNETFEISGAQKGKGSIAIYNRSGALIYKNNHYYNEWPERDLASGIYYFVFSYPTCEDRKGWIHLIK